MGSILKIINLVLSLALRFMRWLDQHRQRKAGRDEVLVEQAQKKDETNAQVRLIHDKLDSDPAYRQKILDEIKARAHKAQ